MQPAQIVSPNKTRFIHYRPYQHDEGICIGYRLNDAETEAVISVHGMLGGYSKKIGRIACVGRLDKGKTIECQVDSKKDVESILKAVEAFYSGRH